MPKSLSLLFFVFSLSFQAHSSNLGCDSKAEPWVEVDGSLMMALRSNACHYWKWSKEEAEEYLPGVLIHPYGFITGDPHHENFSHIFSEGKRVYVLNDFDDVGYGSVYLDFLKFLGVSRSVTKSQDVLNTELMFENYIAGLSGQSWSQGLPAALKEDASVTQEEFIQRYRRKVDKKTNDKNQFKKDDGLFRYSKLETLQRVTFDRLEENLFSQALPQGYEILDRALSIKLESGGSAGLIRYLYFIRNSHDKEDLQIIEFKPIIESSLSSFNPNQLTAEQRGEKAFQVFWPQSKPENFKIVSHGENVFLMRPKYPSYVDVGTAYFKEHKKEFSQLSYFIAHKMGELHGAQLNSSERKDFIQRLSTDKSATVESARRFIEAYLDVVKKEHGKK